jgi:pantetheine-phosphate adenylyltransferase
MKKKIIYPGSFDPFTNGHLAIVRRGLEVFGEVVVVVAYNSIKKGLFTIQERMDMISKTVAGMSGVEVDSYEGLVVDYVALRKSNVILRGLRAGSDFDYEFNLALFNRRLAPDIQSIFLMTDYNWLYVSSSTIKEVAQLGGDISGLVSEPVIECLCQKFPKLQERRRSGGQ